MGARQTRGIKVGANRDAWNPYINRCFKRRLMMIDPMTTRYMELKQTLSAQQLAIVESEMSRQSKNATIAILLAFFLGAFGAHQFYMGRPGLGVTMLLITVFGIPLSFIGIGVVMLLAMGIWALVSCFTLSGECERFNRALEMRLIASMAPAQSGMVGVRA
jgi:TM2 domain-containing membrane protein YozV